MFRKGSHLKGKIWPFRVFFSSFGMNMDLHTRKLINDKTITRVKCKRLINYKSNLFLYTVCHKFENSDRFSEVNCNFTLGWCFKIYMLAFYLDKNYRGILMYNPFLLPYKRKQILMRLYLLPGKIVRGNSRDRSLLSAILCV